MRRRAVLAAQADLVRAAERERLRALVDADAEATARLHADDFQLITPDGVPLSKADYLGALASGAIAYRVFEPTSELAVLLSGDLAAIRYQCRIEIVAFGTEYVDRGWHTDVYAWRDGRWQAVLSQMTRIIP
jgi:ketosteroid isomerase-like protein